MAKPDISEKKCNNCGTCIEICPMGVFAFQEKNKQKRVIIKKPGECVGCKACEVQCERGAITIDE